MQAVLYTWARCPFCVRAKEVLEQVGVPYTEHVMDDRGPELLELKRKYAHPTVPIILLDDEFVGGCNELEALVRSGGLQR